MPYVKRWALAKLYVAKLYSNGSGEFAIIVGFMDFPPCRRYDHEGAREIDALEDSLRALYVCRTLLGTVPPCPPTVRGRVGALAVRAVRRALFWFIPQVDSYCAASIDLAHRHVAALERMAENIHDNDVEIKRTQEQLLQIVRSLEKYALADTAEAAETVHASRMGIGE